MAENRQLNLPAELCIRAEEKFKRRFASVEELVVFVLEELVQDQASELDKSEQALIETRLRDLGYL